MFHLPREQAAPLVAGRAQELAWAQAIREEKYLRIERHYNALIREALADGKQPAPQEELDRMAAHLMARLNRYTDAEWWLEHDHTSAIILLRTAWA
jgi:hypothetical protein